MKTTDENYKPSRWLPSKAGADLYFSYSASWIPDWWKRSFTLWADSQITNLKNIVGGCGEGKEDLDPLLYQVSSLNKMLCQKWILLLYRIKVASIKQKLILFQWKKL